MKIKNFAIMLLIAFAIFQSSNSLSVQKSNLKEEKGVNKFIKVASVIDKIASAFTGGLSAPAEIGSLVLSTANKIITSRIQYYMLNNESKLKGCDNAVKFQKYPKKEELSYVKNVIKFARDQMKNIRCNDSNANGFYTNCVIVLCANPSYGIAKDKRLCKEDIECKK